MFFFPVFLANVSTIQCIRSRFVSLLPRIAGTLPPGSPLGSLPRSAGDLPLLSSFPFADAVQRGQPAGIIVGPLSLFAAAVFSAPSRPTRCGRRAESRLFSTLLARDGPPNLETNSASSGESQCLGITWDLPA